MKHFISITVFFFSMVDNISLTAKPTKHSVLSQNGPQFGLLALWNRKSSMLSHWHCSIFFFQIILVFENYATFS